MTVNLLSVNKLKITLSAAELEAVFGDYNRIDYQSADTRLALGELLRCAAPEADFELDSSSVRIEVYPTCEGGCAIYFTKSEAPLCAQKTRRASRAGRYYLLEFSQSSALLDAIADLYADRATREAPSRLYRLEERYRLALAANPEVSRKLPHLQEYCDRLLRRNVDLAYTEEYGRLLQGRFAVREIGAALRQG